jgi:hypothetical protein
VVSQAFSFPASWCRPGHRSVFPCGAVHATGAVLRESRGQCYPGCLPRLAQKLPHLLACTSLGHTAHLLYCCSHMQVAQARVAAIPGCAVEAEPIKSFWPAGESCCGCGPYSCHRCSTARCAGAVSGSHKVCTATWFPATLTSSCIKPRVLLPGPLECAEEYHQRYLEKGGQCASKGCNDSIRCYG